jgi:magnesium-transporting ATPase (P-type)
VSSDVESDAELGRLLPQNYHFAMSGKTWGVVRTHFYHLLPKLITRGTIFARMAPEQKAQLVEEYQAIDYVSFWLWCIPQHIHL